MKRLAHTYHWVIQPLLVIGILAFGFLGAMSMTLFKEEPRKNERATYSPLVRVVTTQRKDQPLIIKGNGAIEARTRINIVPQVGGRIVSIHPNLRAGGTFKKNETLLQIERIDYELAVTAAEAEVAQAQTTLELERAEAEAAREEWRLLNPGQPVPTLVGREPQIAEAVSTVMAAKARLQQAQLELERTRVSMPFDGRVVQASIDIGEVIPANQSVAVVYSSERFEVRVPLELEDLVWVDLPDKKKKTAGSEVTVHVPVGSGVIDIPAQFARIESELDERSRFAFVVVSLPSHAIPQEIHGKVIPGLFVDVSIKTEPLPDVSTIPRATLREGGRLWIVQDNRLQFVKPDIIYQSDSELIVRDLPEATLLITSQLDVVTDGMQVRIAQTP